MEGIITKGIGGLYTVQTDKGIYTCKPRGIFRKKKMTPLVGDRVDISILDENLRHGVMEDMFERDTEMLRPRVANVTQAIIVFAIKDPLPNINLLDKMIVLAEKQGLKIVLCFNKSDLDSENSFNKYYKIYTDAGYKVIKTCASDGIGIDELNKELLDDITVFAGPSGVGKSSLLNTIHEGFNLKTGVVSEKIKRGKHTTRHSEIMPLKNGGMVVDTPGFTSLEVENIDEVELTDYFREFHEFQGACKYDNCIHISEPKCGILTALKEGKISRDRYNSYIYFINEIKELRRNKKW